MKVDNIRPKAMLHTKKKKKKITILFMKLTSFYQFSSKFIINIILLPTTNNPSFCYLPLIIYHARTNRIFVKFVMSMDFLLGPNQARLVLIQRRGETDGQVLTLS